MALSQDALIGIFVAIVAADIIVIVLALLWSRVTGRERSRPATGAAPAQPERDRMAQQQRTGGNGNGGNEQLRGGEHERGRTDRVGRARDARRRTIPRSTA